MEQTCEKVEHARLSLVVQLFGVLWWGFFIFFHDNREIKMNWTDACVHIVLSLFSSKLTGPRQGKTDQIISIFLSLPTDAPGCIFMALVLMRALTVVICSV